MSADLEKLLPCPFCGEKVRIQQNGRNPDGSYSYWEAACDECDYVAHAREDRAKTIAAWNTRALTAENAALRAMAEWRCIVSAPKDGTNVDLWGVNLLTHDKRQERIVNVAWGTVTDWMGREREDWKHGRGEDFQPTHWRPQPDPPEETP